MYSVLRFIANELQDDFFEQVLQIFHQTDTTLEISKHRRENSAAISISFNENTEQHLAGIVEFLTYFQNSIAACKKLDCEIQCDLAINSVEKYYYSIKFDQQFLNALTTNNVELSITVYPAYDTN